MYQDFKSSARNLKLHLRNSTTPGDRDHRCPPDRIVAVKPRQPALTASGSSGDLKDTLRTGYLGEEVVALVVDHDERREVDDLDPPDRLHAQLGVLQHLDLADAV